MDQVKNTKKEIRSDFQMKYLYTNTVSTEKRMKIQMRYSSMKRLREDPDIGAMEVTPRLGNWDIKSLEGFVALLNTGVCGYSKSLHIQKLRNIKGSIKKDKKSLI